MARSAQTPQTIGSDINETDFAISQWVFRNLHTAAVVQVEAVYPELPGTPNGDKRGFVDVKLVLEQEDNEGKVIKTKTLFGLPYSRIQGGPCAFVVDPKKGDWGWAVFSERDIAKWKRSKTRTAPESRRMFDQADGIYLGGILNAVPKMYVQIHEEKGIVIESDAKDLKVHVGGNANVFVEGTSSTKVSKNKSTEAQNISMKASNTHIDGNNSISGNETVGGTITAGGVVTAAGFNTGGGGGGGGGGCSMSADGSMGCGSMSCSDTASCGQMDCQGDMTCGGNSSCAGNSSCGGKSSCGELSVTGNASCGGTVQATDFEIPGVGKLSDLLKGMN